MKHHLSALYLIIYSDKTLRGYFLVVFYILKAKNPSKINAFRIFYDVYESAGNDKIFRG